MVAAEFWEQGDLERTVLDQQPIVRFSAYLGFNLHDKGWQEALIIRTSFFSPPANDG